jgi:RNA polymerase-binding transcription factor DksA
MSTNESNQGFDNAVDRDGGFVWNRLHSEREDICEALLKEFRPGVETQAGFAGMAKADATGTENWHRELLQVRLSKIDDALDRLMAGSYGNCRKCGKWIEDTKLDFDSAIAFCIECWRRLQTKH